MRITREVAHTTGPWQFQEDLEPLKRDGKWPYLSIFGSDSFELAQVNGNGHSTSRANARLIAAAPELLEALKRITPLFAEAFDDLHDCDDSGGHEVVLLARAAIAKAEGRE